MTKFTVEGEGEFPIAMLRRCRCWPAAEIDDRALRRRHVADGRDDLRRRRITLESPSDTVDRGAWDDAGWPVVDQAESRTDISS